MRKTALALAGTVAALALLLGSKTHQLDASPSAMVPAPPVVRASATPTEAAVASSPPPSSPVAVASHRGRAQTPTASASPSAGADATPTVTASPTSSLSAMATKRARPKPVKKPTRKPSPGSTPAAADAPGQPQGAPSSDGPGAGPGKPTTTAPTKPTTTAPTKPTTTAPSTATAAPRAVNGSTVNTLYGDVQVRITVSAAGVITAVTMLKVPDQDDMDRDINDQAIPKLIDQTLSRQSAQLDNVSGATYTSGGYMSSLQSAIDAAGL